ncbi:hypothetical protein DMB92_09065 [Campylobacter sp. MIT 99-7217]|uniref:hypothetical protein n=1 Tax=Campylobacter sp. MIT 99-7217 TaxID=535091 RepID=UPI001157ABA2|nr:hypothetical protein [Campylobacter sp. MIT 99-7217]TQR28709.1 hypothetical protein DMB92_09065 [Campylobacter sp. MIT 99-7217]
MGQKAKKWALKARMNKFKRKALNKWRPILNEYDLRVGDEFLNYASEQYGWAKAERGFLGFIANFFFAKPLNVLLVAAAACLTILSGGTLAPIFGQLFAQIYIVAVVSATIINYASKIYQAQKSFLIAQDEYSAKASAFALTQNTEAAKKRAKESEAITKDMIYGGYAIYANGAIYKNQFAGINNNFSSQIAPDSAKGIFGQATNSNIDEALQNRSGGGLAGGENFASKALNMPFPLASSFDSSQYQTMIQEAFLARSLKTIKGFNKLVENDFGMNTYDSFLKEKFNELDEKTMKPFKANLSQLDFLNKNKAYNKAILRDFDTLLLSDFKELESPDKKLIQKAQKAYEGYLNVQKQELNLNSDASQEQIATQQKSLNEKKAKSYVENVEYLLNLILNADFYSIKAFDEQELDHIYKEKSTLFNKASLMQGKKITEILKAKKEEFKDFYKLESFVKDFLALKPLQKCIGFENDKLAFSEARSARRVKLLNEYYLCEFETKDMLILEEFAKKGIPKASVVDSFNLNAFYEGF